MMPIETRKPFKSPRYYQCVLDLEHCDKFGFDKRPVYDKYKKFQLSKVKIDMIYKWKKSQPEKWRFFEKHATIMQDKVLNWKKMNISDRHDITEYMDFFVYRYEGQAFRWDGNPGFKDKHGRELIKTFSGTNKLVSKIIYATKSISSFHYSYKKMAKLDVYQSGDKRNVFNLKAKKKLSDRQKAV